MNEESQLVRVLVVDDEEGLRKAITRALYNFSVNFSFTSEDVRIEVDTAASGNEALKKIESFEPDILLLDYKLPDITGLDILKQLEDRKDDFVTIMITAFASLNTAINAIKLGAYDFVAKPFTPNELKISLRKAIRQIIAVRQARKLKAERDRVKFEAISVMTHELKAPLAAVENFINILKDPSTKENDETYDHCVNRSLARLQGMRKLISDMLNFSAIEANIKERDIGEVNLRSLAETAIETVEDDARARQIKIELNTDDVVRIRADQSEMEIILNNLITNAVKYNKDYGSVKIDIVNSEGGIKISTADTGIGLTPEEQRKLFKDFVRIKNKQTRRIEGSGLGLSTVMKLAKRYNGYATVESESGKGSLFTVLVKDAV
jgi:two-component system sensor histidine kinase/response regulator